MSDSDRIGSAWLPEEVVQLRRLADGGLTATAVASKMCRARAGILKKAVSERLSLDPEKHQSR